MMRQDKTRKIWLFSAENLQWSVFLIAALAVFVISSPASGSQAMITQFSGSGFIYENSSADKTRLQPFMKLHDGDRISLQSGAQLQLIYFSNARKEVWRGPADFTIRSSAAADKVPVASMRRNRRAQFSDEIDPSRLQTAGVETVRGLNRDKNDCKSEAKARREPVGFVSDTARSQRDLNQGCETVLQLPAVVSRELQRISRIVDPSSSVSVRNNSKGNGPGGNDNEWVTLNLSPGNSFEVTQAENIYDELKKKLPDNDVTAELFLFSVLSRYRKFSKMEELLTVMRRKQPENKTITYLAEWLKSLQTQ